MSKINPKPSNAPDAKAPEGFRWISNESSAGAYITVDNQLRLYLSTGTRELLNLGPSGKENGVPSKLIIGYDAVNKRLVVAKPEVVRATDVKPFNFDRRSYSSARVFVREIGVSGNELPLRYNYVGKEYGEYPSGAYVFESADE